MSASQPDRIVLKRAKAYLAKVPAINGTDLSAGVVAARAAMDGFDLGMEAGAALFKSEYAGRCTPPLSDQQITEIISRAAQVQGNKPKGWLLKDSSGYNAGLSDLGNANYLVKHFGNDVRFCHDWNLWFLWDGSDQVEDAFSQPHRRQHRSACGTVSVLRYRETHQHGGIGADHRFRQASSGTLGEDR